tara:strand:+ start:671 stop:1018 length:348 start_codon:yes stop_codon:yes gene_type:complete
MKTKRDKDNVEFIKDGYTNEELMKKITEIREKYVLNENKLTNDIIEKEIKVKYSFFNERYPFLFDMILKKDLDVNTLNYMLKMRNDIVNNNVSFEKASEKIGLDMYDKYQNNNIK